MPRPNHTLETRIRDEAEYFYEPLTDAERTQIARRTSKRPGLCLVIVIAAAIFADPIVDGAMSVIHWLAGVL
ncbi:hypothetical protein [Paraburkholderia sp. 2C]